jgi:large subunit ribosomal protein L10
MSKEAHVSEVKKKEIIILKELLEKNNIIGIIDITDLPSAQFQKLRNKLKDSLVIRVAKKNLIKLAIEELKDKKKGIEKLEECLDSSMPALIFTEQDPFKLAKILNKNKSTLPAKAGQISPKDIIIPEGPTPFPAGPIVGELAAAGVKATIEDGKIIVKQASTLVKSGVEITAKQADLLAKFKIEPMEIGLNVISIYQDGEVYKKDVLAIDEETVLADLKSAASGAFNVAIFTGYPTKETVDILLKKAEAESLALSQKVPEDDEVKDEPKEEPKPTEEAPKEKEKPVESEQPKEEEPKPVEVEQPVEEIKEPEEKTFEESPKEEPKPVEEPAPEEKPVEKKVDGVPSADELKKESQSDQSNEQSGTQKDVESPVGYTEENSQGAQEIINKMKDNINGGQKWN